MSKAEQKFSDEKVAEIKESLKAKAIVDSKKKQPPRKVAEKVVEDRLAFGAVLRQLPLGVTHKHYLQVARKKGRIDLTSRTKGDWERYLLKAHAIDVNKSI